MLSRDVVRAILADERFSRSHGGDGREFLGLGILYYGLAYAYRAKRCVCLGSGSGFVPRLMRQAQRDLALQDSETILVDADLPHLGYGTTDYYGPEPTAFRKLYPEVKIVKRFSQEYALEVPQPIDYLHIDADHSYPGVRADFEAYAPKMSPVSVVTLHDSLARGETAGVWRLIREIRDHSTRWDVIEIPLGMGTAILTRRIQ